MGQDNGAGTAQIEDGGPAFPGSAIYHQANDTTYTAEDCGAAPGMSQRAYIATKLMAAQHAAFSALETTSGWTNEEMARDAVAKADALLKVLAGVQQ